MVSRPFPPTRRQLDLLRFIVGHQQARGCSPTFREMAAGIGLVAMSGVSRMLDDLEQRGLIRRLPDARRTIEVLDPPSIPMVGETPLYAVPGPWDQFEHSESA